MHKKSQGGMNAAILVAIIAGLIILYIIFLPASERERLLENKTIERTASQPSSGLLLQAFPGTLSTASGLEEQKSIPDVFLVETTNAKELKRINPFIIRSGWFEKKAHTVDFELEDPENTDNLVLTFTTKKRNGILSIKLNNAIIFENELQSDSPEPVRLDKDLLNKKNSLEFSVSSVGIKFWTTNEYSFDNMKMIGDITDTSRQESANVFTLTEAELASLKQATLRFIPFCGTVNELGGLDIYLNNKKLFSTVPSCDNSYKQSIPKSLLGEGENNIVFKTSKGSYSIEQIKIGLEFKEPVVKTYYFEVDKDAFKKMREGSKNIKLTIKFAEDKKLKRAKLDVNGHAETIETDKAIFSKNIDSKISEGNNFVRLEPLTDLEVVELKIEVV